MKLYNELATKFDLLTKSHEKEANNLLKQMHEAWITEGGMSIQKQARAEQKASRKEKYKTTNGLTVYKLRQAGVTVKVTHIRYCDLPGVNTLTPVPSYLRGLYDFTPKGGATHIKLTNLMGETIALTSVCHHIDSFDYKMGVKIALDQILQHEADELLAGLEATLDIADCPPEDVDESEAVMA
jgi:hypothetical protein